MWGDSFYVTIALLVTAMVLPTLGLWPAIPGIDRMTGHGPGSKCTCSLSFPGGSEHPLNFNIAMQWQR